MTNDEAPNGDANPLISGRQLDDLLANGIKPNSERIADILVRKEIAVVVHQLAPGDQEGNEEAITLGWDGESPVFELGVDLKARLIAQLEADGDQVAARWFRGGRCGRILVVTGYGTLFVNHDVESGYSIEGAALDSGHEKT